MVLIEKIRSCFDSTSIVFLWFWLTPLFNPSLAELIPLSLNKGIITDNHDQTFIGFSDEQFSILFASPLIESEKAGC